MEEIFSLEELIIMGKGFAEYIDNLQNNKFRFLCHPIYDNKVFCIRMPGVDWMNSGRKLPIYFSFLGSTDGESWGACDLEEMIESMRNGGSYYISDLGCRTYLEVDFSMLEDLLEFLSREMPVSFLDTDAWEEGELGELTTLSMKEAIASMNFDVIF